MCRAVSDRDLEVAAHAGGERGRSPDGPPATPPATSASRANARVRLPAQRRHRHQPGQPQRRRAGHRLGHRVQPGVRIGRPGQRAAPAGSPSMLTWTSTSSGRSRSGRGRVASAAASRTLSTECTTSAYRTTERALLRCSCPTKCQRAAAPGGGHLGGLRRRLLVPVLPHVGHAEPGQRAARRWPGTSWSPRPA